MVIIQHDLTKKRTCTFGLHGPWGESSPVFIRVSFSFPRDYPQALHPHGTPTVDLERNPLMSVQAYALIIKRLRSIREQRRPCLEPCLRFLLTGHESEVSEDDTESSDDDGLSHSRRSRQLMASLLRTSKNLVEPRSCQGIFAPSGLCAFFCHNRGGDNVSRNQENLCASSARLPVSYAVHRRAPRHLGRLICFSRLLRFQMRSVTWD